MKNRKCLITTIAVIISCGAVPSWGVTLAQALQTDSGVPYKSVTPLEESTIDRTAIVALRQISQARSDIHRRDLASARRDLAEADRLIETIRDNLSTASSKNLIQVARRHLEYEPARQVMHDLPPIYSSLEMISVYLPTDKAKLHVDRAKGYLERNDKRGADKELALADNSMIIIEIELPLLKSQQYIKKAQGYLAARNAGKAEVALQSAEQRVMTLYTGVHSPLFQANRSIWMAVRNYPAAGKADTGHNLEQARVYLGQITAERSPLEKEEAGKLSKEIDGMEKKLADEGKVAESDLKAVWEKSAALTERSAAYLSADLSESKTSLRGDNNLIEAKLHVAYAETYQLTTAEPGKAARELEMAQSYLQKAADSHLAGPADRKKIRRIGNVLLALKSYPEKSDAEVRDRYDTVKDEMGELIKKM
jgi:hypothetical protein